MRPLLYYSYYAAVWMLRGSSCVLPVVLSLLWLQDRRTIEQSWKRGAWGSESAKRSTRAGYRPTLDPNSPVSRCELAFDLLALDLLDGYVTLSFELCIAFLLDSIYKDVPPNRVAGTTFPWSFSPLFPFPSFNSCIGYDKSMLYVRYALQL